MPQARLDDGAFPPFSSAALQGDPERVALRDGVFAGDHLDPGWDFSGFETFLRDDRGAFAAWFGADAFDAIQGHDGSPQRVKAALRGRVERDIAALDAMIARQIDAILHHPRFSRLEGSWRGLFWLVSSLDPAEDILVRAFSMKWAELERDFSRALEFDQSAFFKLVYESEFGHAGGQPFGLMVVDHEIAHKPARRTVFDDVAPSDDPAMLRQLAAVAAAAFVPMVLSIAPRLLGVGSFSELSLSQNITAVLDDEDHRRWRNLTTMEDSRFLCLALPRLRARPRWTRDNNRLRHEEYAPDTADQCWYGAGYGFAKNVLRAQQNFRWPADIRGVTPGKHSGSYVSDPVEEPFRFGRKTRIARAATELGFSDRQSQALVDAGFLPLNTLPFGGVAFASTRSLQARAPEPRRPNPEHANRRISSEIVSLLCICRFAHHIKMLGRDMIGRLATPDAIQRELQDWLGRYTNGSHLSSGESRARYPLLSSNVRILAQEEQPGNYRCVIRLQPHYQLDDISTTFRLVTNLSAASQGGAGRGGNTMELV